MHLMHKDFSFLVQFDTYQKNQSKKENKERKKDIYVRLSAYCLFNPELSLVTGLYCIWLLFLYY